MEGREIIWEGDRYRLVRASASFAGVERLAPWEAADLVRRWARAGRLGAVVGWMDVDPFATYGAHGDAGLAERLAEELARVPSRFAVLRVPLPRPAVTPGRRVVTDLRDLTDDPGRVDDEEIEHWIEIRLVDEAARPIGGERYVLDLPEGRSQEGRTSDLGIIRLDPLVKPGACRVHFPDLEARLAANG